MALIKINSLEVMTTWAARNKYPINHIVMIKTKFVDGGDNDLGYVIYTYDNNRDIRNIPREEIKGKPTIFTLGINAEPHKQIGGIEFYEKI